MTAWRPLPVRTGLVTGLLVAGLMASGLLLTSCGAAPGEPMVVGREAPAFELEDLEGKRLGSEELKGEITVLSFWATWCQPCLREIPVLRELQEKGEVRVVSIALDAEGVRAVAPFVAKKGIDYPVLLGNQELFERYDGLTIPYTLLLNTEGRVARIYRGVITRNQLWADIAVLAGAPES